MTLFVFLACISISYSQVDLECLTRFNAFDSLLMIKKDTAKALATLDQFPERCVDEASAGRHYLFFNLFIESDPNRAKRHLRTASEKGYLASKITKESYFRTLEYIEKKTSASMVSELMDEAYSQLRDLPNYNKQLRNELIRIDFYDQALRKDREMKVGRNVFYSIRWGEAIGDTIENFEEKMRHALDFRRKDSIVLQKFVTMISDLGYVPSEESVLFAGIDVLICHLSHFNWEEDIDSIFQHSIQIGTLSPRVYGWYRGYNEEYYVDKPKTYYYSHNELMLEEVNLSDSDVKRINKLREDIGLPYLPGSVWDYGSW